MTYHEADIVVPITRKCEGDVVQGLEDDPQLGTQEDAVMSYEGGGGLPNVLYNSDLKNSSDLDKTRQLNPDRRTLVP